MPKALAALPALLVLASLGASWILASEGQPQFAYLGTMGAILVIAVAAGAARGRWDGALINARNLVSLAQFQALLWTIAVIGGFAAMVIARMQEGLDDPLLVDIPTEVLGLCGIASGSLGLSKLVSARKRAREPSERDLHCAAAELGEDPEAIHESRRGTAYANSTFADARWTDMFEGDEVGNAAHVEITKLQMFMLTVIAVIAYAMAVFRSLEAAEHDALPAVSEGLAWILGLSHAGYLAGKSADQSGSTPALAAAPAPAEPEAAPSTVYAPEGD